MEDSVLKYFCEEVSSEFGVLRRSEVGVVIEARGEGGYGRSGNDRIGFVGTVRNRSWVLSESYVGG